MQSRVSFFSAVDGTPIGNLEGLVLDHVPAPGARVVFAGEINNNGFPYRVTDVEHVIHVDERDLQVVNMHLSRAKIFASDFAKDS